jgi:predicted DNA-binding transcriptional regulator AlpA
MDSQFLSVKEVASFLSKSEKWVYLRQRDLPGYFKLGKSIFFDKQLLITALRQLATQPRQKKPQGRNDPHGLL